MSGFEIYAVIAQTAIVLLLIVEVVIGVISLRRTKKKGAFQKDARILDDTVQGRGAKPDAIYANIPYFAPSGTKLRV